MYQMKNALSVFDLFMKGRELSRWSSLCVGYTHSNYIIVYWKIKRNDACNDPDALRFATMFRPLDISLVVVSWPVERWNQIYIQLHARKTLGYKMWVLMEELIASCSRHLFHRTNCGTDVSCDPFLILHQVRY